MPRRDVFCLSLNYVNIRNDYLINFFQERSMEFAFKYFSPTDITLARKFQENISNIHADLKIAMSSTISRETEKYLQK